MSLCPDRQTGCPVVMILADDEADGDNNGIDGRGDKGDGNSDNDVRAGGDADDSDDAGDGDGNARDDGDSSDDAGNESAGEKGVGSDGAAPDSAGSYGDDDGNINQPQRTR